MTNRNAIVIMGGGLVKDKQSGKWRTTNFNEGDKFGVQGDRLRVIAADYLFKDNPERVMIALGGKGQLKDIPDAPAVSEAIKNELLELGVPEEKIIREGNSGNSWQQLMEMKKIIKERGLADCEIISNEFHLPRIKAMIEKDTELNEKFNNDKIKLIGAEEIVLRHNPAEWQDKIKTAYESEAMRERIKLEEKGTRGIKGGRYKLI